MMSFFLWCLIEFWALRSGMEGCAWLGNLKKKKDPWDYKQMWRHHHSFREKVVTLTRCCDGRHQSTWRYILVHTGKHRHTQEPAIRRPWNKQRGLQADTQKRDDTDEDKGNKCEGFGPLSQGPVYMKVHRSGILPEIAIFYITP